MEKAGSRTIVIGARFTLEFGNFEFGNEDGEESVRVNEVKTTQQLGKMVETTTEWPPTEWRSLPLERPDAESLIRHYFSELSDEEQKLLIERLSNTL